LTPTRDNAAKAPEYDQAEPLRQDQAILQLSCEHIASEVSPRRIASQFIVGAIDTVSIEGRFAGSAAKIGVIGQDLLLAQTPIFVELTSVGLEGILNPERRNPS
jgi:hypothetical protein